MAKLSIYLSDETAMLLADMVDHQQLSVSKFIDNAIQATAESMGYQIISSKVKIVRPDGVVLK